MIARIDKDTCNGCGLCVEICIMDVLRMNTSIDKAYIAYPEDCQLCYQCELECPTEAIEVDFTPVKRPLVIEYSAGQKND